MITSGHLATNMYTCNSKPQTMGNLCELMAFRKAGLDRNGQESVCWRVCSNSPSSLFTRRSGFPSKW